MEGFIPTKHECQVGSSILPFKSQTFHFLYFHGEYCLQRRVAPDLNLVESDIAISSMR